MSGQAATIKLTERQLLILQCIERSTTASSRLIQRVRLILLAFGGLLNSLIAAEVSLKSSQVGLWRRHWRESFEALTLIECQESAAELQPHRSKYWLNTTEKDPRIFEQQVGAVCNCYLEAPTQTSQPMRIEYEYTRHGTVCLIKNWHVVTGKPRTQRQIRGVKKRCHSQCIFVRFDSSCPICLPAQALIMIAFIKYFNATFARPFRWTYTGKPLGKREEKKEPRTWRSLWNATKMAA